MSDTHDVDEIFLENILGAEELEDAMSMSALDEADSYLDSEAHHLAELQVMGEYEFEHGSMDGFESLLEDRLSGMQQEESGDISMYARIQERLDRVQSPEARSKLLARFAPEILKGRERSMRLIANLERRLAKARSLDTQRGYASKRSVSLKPKFAKEKEREHPGRVKESTSDGYPY